jgi:type II secretory pathway predicted ATPase ExeA
MDLAPFGMTFRPFAPGPDPAGYYPAPAHDEVLNRTVAALSDDEPFVAIVGDPGVGKTLIAHLVLGQMPADTITAFVTNCHFARRQDLLQAILYEVGLPYAGRPEQELRLAFTDFAFAQHRDGRKTVVVLDEAHLLSADLLEEIRLMGNLETPRGRAVQVLLVGLPALLTTIDTPELAGLAQRLTARAKLTPFILRECVEYLGFQVERAGGQPDHVFADEAIEVLARGSRGIPRVLNQAAHNALALTVKAGLETVDVEAAMESLVGMPFAGSTDCEEFVAPPPRVAKVPDENAILNDDPWRGPTVAPHRYEFVPLKT